MKYLGAISDSKDLVNKGYVDGLVGKVKLSSTSTSGSYPITFGPTSITSDTSYQEYYNTAFYYNPSTRNFYVSNGTTNGNIYLGLSTSDSLYTAINNLGWTSAVIE